MASRAVIRRIEVADEYADRPRPQPPPARLGGQRGRPRRRHRLLRPGPVRAGRGGGQAQRPGHRPGRGPGGGRQGPDRDDVGFDPDLAAATSVAGEEAGQRRGPDRARPARAWTTSRTTTAPQTSVQGLAGGPDGGAAAEWGRTGRRRPGRAASAGIRRAGDDGPQRGHEGQAAEVRRRDTASPRRPSPAGSRGWPASSSRTARGSSTAPARTRWPSTGMALLPFLAAGETHKFGNASTRRRSRTGSNWLMARTRLRRVSWAPTTCTPTPSPPWPCARRPA